LANRTLFMVFGIALVPYEAIRFREHRHRIRFNEH